MILQPAEPDAASSPRADNPRLVVLDSQAIFDWLVFRNPICGAWDAAFSGVQWKWIFTSSTKAEFDFVAAKGFGEARPVPFEAVAGAWARLAHEVPEPAPLGADRRIGCSDPDDQKFIDLAIAVRAHTLVSRDKALLKLRRKAWARHGLAIVTPADWRPGDAMQASAH
jgi:hypothetical protein